MKNKITEKQFELLKYCIREYPNLIKLIEEVDFKDLDIEQYEEFRDLVNDEFLVYGLREDYEPNKYGDELEDLHEAIGRFIFWPENN
jgi:hypothetical protein